MEIYGIEFRALDSAYSVSRCGRVLRHGALIAPRRHNHGYLVVGRNRLVHRMVAMCWLEPREGAKLVHHINHDKADNRAENLMWVTAKEHIADHHEGQSRGHRMSEQGKQRLRELRLGSKTPEATKQKQREAALRLGQRPPPRPVGTKLGPEARARMSENSPNARACEIDGVAYASFNEASRALGAKPHTLRKRCLSQNFPSYQLAKGH